MKRNLIYILLFSFYSLSAQIPTGYYNSAVGKTEAALKTALSGILQNQKTERTYSDLWTDFQTTDKRADGKVWDMYSNCTFTFGLNQDSGSGGSAECQYYNREHSMPNSWFNRAYPMYSDLFHMYPTDKYVNNARGNFPFGETTSGTVFGNGSKLGSSSFAGYTGTVFEPINEYKGDFARTYFYMVTAYDDRVAAWVSDQLAGNQYPALSTWSVALFLKWNSQDGVSDKETNRNEAVYGIQKNRNPFIDHPELAEFIWGSRKGELWSLTSAVDELKINFTLSPNPVRNQMTISTDETDLTYSIYNLSGQLLQENKLNGTQVISVDNLNNGMYLIQIQSGNRRTVQKFIVNH